jgi:hypothetical protein
MGIILGYNSQTKICHLAVTILYPLKFLHVAESTTCHDVTARPSDHRITYTLTHRFSHVTKLPPQSSEEVSIY